MSRSQTITSKSEVMNILANNLDEFSAFGVRKVGLFGSFVRNEQHDQSDIDILVDLTNHDYWNYCDLLDFAEGLFPGRKVDVVTKGGLDCNSGVVILREVEYANQSN